MWRSLHKVAILLALSSALFAQQSSVEQAWQLASNGKRAEALTLLSKIIHSEPGDVDARLLYGSLLTEAGDAPSALLQLSEAVRLRPQSAEAQNALGEAFVHFSDSASARPCFQRAVALKPDFAIARLNLGQALLEANQLQPAAQQLDQAITLLDNTADAADAHYLRAKVFTAQGDPGHAAAQLEKAVGLRPDMAEAWSDLGQSRKALLDDAGAVSALERAVRLNEADPVAQYRLGAQYLEQDKLDAAITHLRQASTLNPTDQSTLNSLQIALRRAGKQAEAAEVKKALAQVLSDRDVKDQNALIAVKINNEGALLEKAGDLHAAAAKYSQALALNPGHVGMRVNYSVALLKLGNWTEGLTQMHEALERDPTNETIRKSLEDALRQAPPNLVPKWK